MNNPRSYVPCKVDANQKEIAAALRKCGWYVCDLHAVANRARLPGFPDLLCVPKFFPTHVWLAEVKMPGEDLTDDEAKFCDGYPGSYVILATENEVINFDRAVRDAHGIG
jgi:hypothetical protein